MKDLFKNLYIADCIHRYLRIYCHEYICKNKKNYIFNITS